MNMRVACRSNDQRGAANSPQTVFHPIAIHDPVAFRRHLAGAQRIDHEALQQIGIAFRIEGLPPPPQLGKMGARVSTSSMTRMPSCLARRAASTKGQAESTSALTREGLDAAISTAITAPV